MKVLMGSQEMANRAYEVGHTFIPPEVVSRAPDFLDGFKILGYGADRIALLALDGVVYKVPHGFPFRDNRQFSEELLLFEHLNAMGISWCPDFYPWGKYVLAMKHYEAVPMTYGELGDLFTEMEDYSEDIDYAQVGWDLDTDQVVLLDGGCSFVRSPALDRPIKRMVTNW